MKLTQFTSCLIRLLRRIDAQSVRFPQWFGFCCQRRMLKLVLQKRSLGRNGAEAIRNSEQRISTKGGVSLSKYLSLANK